MADPAGRFSIGFANDTLDWAVDWTHLDQAHPNLVTSYQIDRGRQYEFDRTDGGRATVELIDQDGILDPANPSGPYYGVLEPLLPARIGRRNPVTGEWFTRFRGWIESFDYTYDPSQRFGRLTLALVDLFEILQAIEMQIDPDARFGDEPPTASAGNVFFQGHPNMPEGEGMLMQQRIEQVLANARIPEEFYVVFSGNVWLWATVYSPGESVLSVIQEAADAEFPGVANVYVDRKGRLCAHGREARFDPEGVEAGTTPDVWDFREFSAGDREAVDAAPALTAQIRRFAFDRGLAKIINYATAFPTRPNSLALTDAELAAQLVKDETSIGRFGYRGWTAQNLQTYRGRPPIDTTDLEETRRFAQYYVDNYAFPRNRVTDIAFRSMRPGNVGSGPTWNLLSRVDISDTVTVTVHGAGGGLFDAEPFFVEGIHEEARALTPDYDDVTLTLDLSPRDYYANNPWES